MLHGVLSLGRRRGGEGMYDYEGDGMGWDGMG